MNHHLPLDAIEEQQELKEIPFIWAVIYGVAAVIIPLILYLWFYLDRLAEMINIPISDDVIGTTIVLSFVCPYIATIAALINAKRNLKVSQRGKLFKHGLYVLLVPAGIGAVVFTITLLPKGGAIAIAFVSLYYIPYIIVGIILSAVQSYFMSRKKTTNTQTSL